MTVARPCAHVCRALASGSTVAVTLLLAVGAALAAGVVGAAPASAHTVLVGSTPANGATLSAPPTHVVLQFDEPVSTSFAAVVVTGPSGTDVATTKPSVQGAKVSTALSAGLVAGAYRVTYRVVSDDGHPVSGETRFRLSLPATATAPDPTSPPLGGPSTTAAGPASLPDESSGIGRFMWPVTGAVLLLITGVGVLVWERRRG